MTTQPPPRPHHSGGDIMADGERLTEREAVTLLAAERAVHAARAAFIADLTAALAECARWRRAGSYGAPQPHYDEGGWRWRERVAG